jgi:hypothetical protein
MKKLLKIVVVLVVLIVIAIGAGFYFIDAIAKTAVERGGEYALGVPTTLKSADVGVFTGEFSMDGLKVANPPDFKSSHFLTMDHGDVAVTLGSLRGSPVELPTLNLKSIDVNIESRGGSSNYEAILESLKKLESGSKPTGDEKKFIVRKVVIEDLKVHANLLPLGGEAAVMNFPIAEIRLTDVGSETTGGMVLSELAGVIVKAVLAAIVEKGGQFLPADLLGDLAGDLANLKSLGDMGVNMAATAGKVIEDVAKSAEGVVGGVVDEGKKIGDEAKKAADEAKKGIGDAVKGIGGLIPGKK